MELEALLIPVTDRPPAKVRDKGIVRLVMEGAAVYNAKSKDLLLLPEGINRWNRTAAEIQTALLIHAGLQPIAGNGLDEGIFSLAERFVREYDSLARAYQETRGRCIRLMGWCASHEEMCSAAEAIGKAISVAAEKLRIPLQFIAGDLGFTALIPAKEGTLSAMDGFRCSRCGAAFIPDSPAGYIADKPEKMEYQDTLEDIPTPGANTIESLCLFLGIAPHKTVKTMLYAEKNSTADGRIIAVFIRGDREISSNKLTYALKKVYGISDWERACDDQILKNLGEVAGFCGPVGLPEKVLTLSDSSLTGMQNAVVGANRTGYHRTGFCFGRDFTSPVEDIASWKIGSACSLCATPVVKAVWREAGFLEASLPHLQDRVLTYKKKEGALTFPFHWHGNIFLEPILLGVTEHTS